jgi:Tfp pilus assembly protein FimT
MTLVELMLGIACLGILSAIAVPYWAANGRPAHRLKNAAHQVVADARLARSRAVATNRQFRLRFDPSSDVYLLEKGDSASGSVSWSSEGGVRRFGLDGGSSFTGVTISGGEEYAVMFRPTGAVSPQTIALQGTGGRTLKVVCSMSGRIRVVTE